MTAAEVATIGATVMVLVQILKKAIPGEGYGVYIAGGVSLVSVLLYVASGSVWPPDRTDIWATFAGFVAVFATAAGLHSISTTATVSSPRRRKPEPEPEPPALRAAGQIPGMTGRGDRG